jgi:hypothetical protein
MAQGMCTCTAESAQLKDTAVYEVEEKIFVQQKI